MNKEHKTKGINQSHAVLVLQITDKTGTQTQVIKKYLLYYLSIANNEDYFIIHC